MPEPLLDVFKVPFTWGLGPCREFFPGEYMRSISPQLFCSQYRSTRILSLEDRRLGKMLFQKDFSFPGHFPCSGTSLATFSWFVHDPVQHDFCNLQPSLRQGVGGAH